jgi:hypothetical protein
LIDTNLTIGTTIVAGNAAPVVATGITFGNTWLNTNSATGTVSGFVDSKPDVAAVKIGSTHGTDSKLEIWNDVKPRSAGTADLATAQANLIAAYNALTNETGATTTVYFKNTGSTPTKNGNIISVPLSYAKNTTQAGIEDSLSTLTGFGKVLYEYPSYFRVINYTGNNASVLATVNTKIKDLVEGSTWMDTYEGSFSPGLLTIKTVESGVIPSDGGSNTLVIPLVWLSTASSPDITSLLYDYQDEYITYAKPVKDIQLAQKPVVLEMVLGEEVLGYVVKWEQYEAAQKQVLASVQTARVQRVI